MRRTGWGATTAILVLLAAACSAPTPTKVRPTHDVADARPIARGAANILLTFSAYDYALVGGLNGDKVRAVNADRFATVAKAQADLVSANTAQVVAATVETAGPVRDRLVALADGLTDLSRDALAYADARDPAAFSRVLAGVDRGWASLRELASASPDDAQLRALIDRGSSIRSSATPAQRFLLTVGPFGSAVEAADNAKRIGPNAIAATQSPFVVRVGPYADRASAEKAAATLSSQRITSIVTDETVYTFARAGAVPDAELWREPERVIEVHAGARKIALTKDASLVATGADDGFITVHTREGVLKSLPKFNAGVNQLEFTDDGRFLMGGGQVINAWVMPAPTDYVGAAMRLTGAAQSLVFIPKSYAFAASSAGTPGLGSGAGILGGRAPDGVPLAAPFPMDLPASGGLLAASDAGDLFIASQTSGGFEVRMVRPGVELYLKGVLRVPGAGSLFAVDPSGTYGAAVTGEGTYRFQINAPDPTKTLTRIATAVRDIKFAADGTLYLLDAKRLVAVDRDGSTRWTAALTDGRRLAVGLRPVVLDGTDHLIALDPKTGAVDDLAGVGQIQDLVVSRDGRWIGLIADARRAVLFRLP
ncbi:MAG TPA: SPOR domain-containing protein [Candidatus Limnocylindria bacterium]|nr:SPOR domain-containing protein [Candidatus Limnocylindria bacterium]